jgi:integrase
MNEFKEVIDEMSLNLHELRHLHVTAIKDYLEMAQRNLSHSSLKMTEIYNNRVSIPMKAYNVVFSEHRKWLKSGGRLPDEQ